MIFVLALFGVFLQYNPLDLASGVSVKYDADASHRLGVGLIAVLYMFSSYFISAGLCAIPSVAIGLIFGFILRAREKRRSAAYNAGLIDEGKSRKRFRTALILVATLLFSGLVLWLVIYIADSWEIGR